MNDVSGFVRSLPEEVILTGSGSFLKKSRMLKAGAISLIYEEGSLRKISTRGNEFIRMIYPAVRDRDWLNIIPEITEESIQADSDSFRISYQATYRNGNGLLTAWYLIEGIPDNIKVSLKAKVITGFEKNRIGFCVLHPSEHTAGKKVRIIHNESPSEDSVFPFLISPHQPFTDIREIHWEDSGTRFRVSFEGDIFEMEDQRNWTDASFKTYSTPLSLPFPVTLSAGTVIEQTVIISITGAYESSENHIEPARITIDPSKCISFPSVGTGATTSKSPVTDNEAEIIRGMRFDHIRYDLYLFSKGWKEIAEMAFLESLRLNTGLEIALFFDESTIGEVEKFISLIKNKKPGIKVISIFHRNIHSTPVSIYETVVPELRKALPECRFSIGTNSNFAQINRARPAEGDYDLISYSIHPQEHASDNTTLIENLRAQTDTVRSSKIFSEGKGIWISPVNIQRRFNANKGNFEIPWDKPGLPPQVDPRLMSLFGACWTTGALKNLIAEGVAGITLYECLGERGFFQGDHQSGWPEGFHSAPGMFFPAYFVLKFLLSEKGTCLVESSSSAPDSAESIFFKTSSGLKGIIVNFYNSNNEVEIENLSRKSKYLQLTSESYPDASGNENWIENPSIWKSAETNIILQKPYSITFLQECF